MALRPRLTTGLPLSKALEELQQPAVFMTAARYQKAATRCCYSNVSHK
ncbi:hypothetical protein CA54_57720 [Symmachiella macrocystis]|uniref:Uncharacterized protein n=1 Tax=Symmachiella macrocystis TaxID=2527985 RepID=A0A5C6B7U0_9PLAN|nr:hypothetical protein CA54_57720 [Symmachiella macrocystis]